MLGFTIDTIKLFLSWEKLEQFDFSIFKEKLRNFKVEKKYRDGIYFWRKVGFYKNFHISYYEGEGIYLTGSISNFYAEKKSLLKYTELKKAVNQLGKEINLNLHNARLYRIDLALNIITDKPVEQYSRFLFCDLSRFKRLEQDNGVLFKTSEKVFSIYNKSLELENKGILLKNILRLEFRLVGGVSDFFGIKEIKISNIYDVNIFLKLLNGFQTIYNNIEKARIPKDFTELQSVTPKILSQFLQMSSVVKELGGQDAMYRLIDQFALEKKISTANIKSRCRKLIKDLSNNKSITKTHPLTEEILGKINDEIEKLIKSTNTLSIL